VAGLRHQHFDNSTADGKEAMDGLMKGERAAAEDKNARHQRRHGDGCEAQACQQNSLHTDNVIGITPTGNIKSRTGRFMQ